MTIIQLQYIIEIEKHGSFNKAAQSLFISQPTLSSAIKEIEKELDCKIFIRHSKGVHVTPKGLAIINQAHKVIAEYNQLKFVNSLNEEYLDVIKISSQHYAFISEALNKYLQKYPQKKFQYIIKECKSYETINDICTLQTDIGFIMINHNNRKIFQEIFIQNNIEVHHLFSPKAHAFLHKTHPLANQAQVTLKQLQEFQTIIFEQDGSSTLTEEFIIQKELDRVIYVSDRGTLQTLICNSNAYNIGTGYLSQEMKTIGIVAKPIVDTILESQLCWIHLKERFLSQQELKFIEIVKEIKFFKQN